MKGPLTGITPDQRNSRLAYEPGLWKIPNPAAHGSAAMIHNHPTYLPPLAVKMASYPISLPLNSKQSFATLTHPENDIWELEMHHGEDNRITSEFINETLGVALDIVEKDWRSGTLENGAPGALVLTGKKSQNKFFSNGEHGSIYLAFEFGEDVTNVSLIGLDYVNTSKDLGFFSSTYSLPDYGYGEDDPTVCYVSHLRPFHPAVLDLS